MSRPYSILTALAPEAYLSPDDFATDYDGINPARAAEQYAKGLDISRRAESVSITCAGTWAARIGNGVMTSCEGIGYHAHTASLLRGFLDGPAPVEVWRYGTDGPAEIKPRTVEECGVECDHGTPCARDRGHAGEHDTRYCTFVTA